MQKSVAPVGEIVTENQKGKGPLLQHIIHLDSQMG